MDHIRFWVFDEYAEVYPEDAVHGMAESIMDALRNPHKPRPANDPLVGEIARQYVSPSYLPFAINSTR